MRNVIDVQHQLERRKKSEVFNKTIEYCQKHEGEVIERLDLYGFAYGIRKASLYEQKQPGNKYEKHTGRRWINLKAKKRKRTRRDINLLIEVGLLEQVDLGAKKYLIKKIKI